MAKGLVLVRLLVIVQVLYMVLCEETTFKYYTLYAKNGTEIKIDNITKGTINILKPVTFIITSGTQTPHSCPQILLDEYLEKFVSNVFLVNWTSSTSVEKSSDALSDFIAEIYEKTEEQYLETHLIGIQGGSKMASLAGKRLFEKTGRKINRITALLDPSYLSNDENAKIENGKFVDVVYGGRKKSTEGQENGGDVRFWIDTDEKRCSDKDFSPLRVTVQLFAKSINSSKFKGVKCEFTNNNTRECSRKEGGNDSSDGIIFGENVDQNAKGDYLVTPACDII